MCVIWGVWIGLVGFNGVGKIILFKMLVGELELDSGNVKLVQNLEFVSFDQCCFVLKVDWIVVEILIEGSGDMVEVNGQCKYVMVYMKDFLFVLEQVNMLIEVFFGGECVWFLLVCVLVLLFNVFIFDELINDFDLEILDLLQDLIVNYVGIVFLVFYDCDFIDCICISILMLEGWGKWVEYVGGYFDMLV